MRKIFRQMWIAMAIVLFTATFTVAQNNVGINDDGTNPDASAQLDVKSLTKGMLIPRLTTAYRDAIASPADGLLVYCTSDKQFWFFKTGSGWTAVGNTSSNSSLNNTPPNFGLQGVPALGQIVYNSSSNFG
jgi:hypothetical protein